MESPRLRWLLGILTDYMIFVHVTAVACKNKRCGVTLKTMCFVICFRGFVWEAQSNHGLGRTVGGEREEEGQAYAVFPGQLLKLAQHGFWQLADRPYYTQNVEPSEKH